MQVQERRREGRRHKQHRDERQRAHHNRRAGGARRARARAARRRGAAASTRRGTLLHVAARRPPPRCARARARASSRRKLRVVSFPAWDTVPYDRVGPNSDIVARRIAALAKLALGARKHPTIVLTTVNAVLQRVPPRASCKRAIKPLAPGQRVDMSQLTQRLALAGYVRTGTVMEPGEYAVRGGILDLFPPGRSSPVRLDFFGDTLESIKAFDAADPAHDQARAEARAHAGERGRVRRGRRERCSARATSSCSAAPPATIRSTRRSAPASAIPARSTGCRCSTSTWRRCSTTCRACR